MNQTATKPRAVNLGEITFNTRLRLHMNANKRFAAFVRRCMLEHARRNWGNVGPALWVENDHAAALPAGGTILSTWSIPAGSAGKNKTLAIHTKTGFFTNVSI